MNRIRPLIFALALALISCGKSDVPANTPAPSDGVEVVIQGGLGGDCTFRIFEAVQSRFPNARAVTMGQHDAYRVDVSAWLDENPVSGKFVYVAHSWASNEAIDTANRHHIDVLILLDPVAFIPGGREIVPPTVTECQVFYADPSGLIRANVTGAVTNSEIVHGTNHGSVCTSARVIDFVCERVTALGGGE